MPLGWLLLLLPQFSWRPFLLKLKSFNFSWPIRPILFGRLLLLLLKFGGWPFMLRWSLLTSFGPLGLVQSCSCYSGGIFCLFCNLVGGLSCCGQSLLAFVGPFEQCYSGGLCYCFWNLVGIPSCYSWSLSSFVGPSGFVENNQRFPFIKRGL